jgi:hypothetical protein
MASASRTPGADGISCTVRGGSEALSALLAEWHDALPGFDETLSRSFWAGSTRHFCRVPVVLGLQLQRCTTPMPAPAEPLHPAFATNQGEGRRGDGCHQPASASRHSDSSTCTTPAISRSLPRPGCILKSASRCRSNAIVEAHRGGALVIRRRDHDSWCRAIGTGSPPALG